MLTTASSHTSLNLHAKRFFLTYAQTGETTKEELRDFLVGDKGAQFFVIGKETHEDGGYHIHAYVVYEKQKRVRDARYFDYNGLHPNIQTVRDPKKCQEYCIKDGEYIANMDLVSGKRTYGDIIKGCSDAQEFLVQVEEHYPRDMVLYFDRISTYADHKWPKKSQRNVVEYTEFVVPDGLGEWAEENIYGR